MAASGRFPDRLSDTQELRASPGRERDIEAFRQWFVAAAGGALLYVCGPGGIGKTTLLHALRAELERADERAVLRDLRAVPAQPAAVEPLLQEALEALGPDGGVILLDSFDAHARLEPWYREWLSAQHGSSVRWVVAGRRTLQRAWLHGADAVRGLTVQRLRPLAGEVSRELLKALPEPVLEHVVELCLGHPGALAEAVRLARMGAQQPAQFMDRVYGAVVDASDVAPSAAHLEALRVGALLPAVDPRLLAAALDTPEAARLYAWLAGHSAVQTVDGKLAMDALLAQALRRDYQLSQPDEYARSVLLLGRLLAERLERANRPEARHAAVEGLLRLGHESGDLPLPVVHVEPLPIEAARALLARDRPDLVTQVPFDGRVQCQVVRGAQGELLGAVLLADPRARAMRQHLEARAIRGFLSARAVSAAERVLLLEPVVFRDGAARTSAARAVFEVVARLLHSDRRLSVGLVASTPADRALSPFGVQLGMLAPLDSVVPATTEHGSQLWFCDHARRGAAACLYGRLVERHAPRGQTVVA